MKSPELLLPAGSLDKMRAAYDFGADAVYAGQPRYSLRARNNEFRLEQIAQGNRQVLLEKMFNLDGEPVQVAQGSPVRVRIPLDGPVEGALISRLL